MGSSFEKLVLKKFFEKKYFNCWFQFWISEWFLEGSFWNFNKPWHAFIRAGRELPIPVLRSKHFYEIFQNIYQCHLQMFYLMLRKTSKDARRDARIRSKNYITRLVKINICSRDVPNRNRTASVDIFFRFLVRQWNFVKNVTFNDF